jgi:hypothetical protein
VALRCTHTAAFAENYNNKIERNSPFAWQHTNPDRIVDFWKNLLYVTSQKAVSLSVKYFYLLLYIGDM